jgi:hypothetical protein
MKPSHIDTLVKITMDLEGHLLNSENCGRAAMEVQLSQIYKRLTTVVGAIQLDQDEMSGALE